MAEKQGKSEEAGPLNGMTILRFTQATETTGGVEQYLKDVNRSLLSRNKLQIVQLYLPLVAPPDKEVRESIGKGTLIRIPMTAESQEADPGAEPSLLRSLIRKSRAKEIFRDGIVYNPLMPKPLRGLFIKRPYSRYDREPRDVREKLMDVFERFPVDLVVIHLAGGWGGAVVAREAAARGIPYAILNHFSNTWFNRVGFREQVVKAAGVGGVSGKDVPSYLKAVYWNLSDGIDTEFFQNDIPEPASGEGISQVLLPARLSPGKGHRDLVRAALLMNRNGVRCRIAFAGRKDGSNYSQELRDFIRINDASDMVSFAGEVSREELRNLLAASRVVALPSHNEGLGRVLLEAQAMELPVVAYDVGGVSDALLNGVSGYLVNKGNVKDLAARLTELLTDEGKRASMGRAGRKFVEDNFSFSTLSRRHEEWYLSSVMADEQTAVFPHP